jgi:hypothetical protein
VEHTGLGEARERGANARAAGQAATVRALEAEDNALDVAVRASELEGDAIELRRRACRPAPSHADQIPDDAD